MYDDARTGPLACDSQVTARWHCCRKISHRLWQGHFRCVQLVLRSCYGFERMVGMNLVDSSGCPVSILGGGGSQWWTAKLVLATLTINAKYLEVSLVILVHMALLVLSGICVGFRWRYPRHSLHFSIWSGLVLRNSYNVGARLVSWDPIVRNVCFLIEYLGVCGGASIVRFLFLRS